jgi:hypothetical protein
VPVDAFSEECDKRGMKSTAKGNVTEIVKGFNPKLNERTVITAIIMKLRTSLLRSSSTCSAIDISAEVIRDSISSCYGLLLKGYNNYV